MKSKIVLDIRKEQKLNNYKATLTGATDRKHGFHIECYRRFIAFLSSHRESYKDQLEKLHQPLEEKSADVST